jgi:regulator of protease activity HflC (stomatin/prohibitin superfamily)
MYSIALHVCRPFVARSLARLPAGTVRSFSSSGNASLDKYLPKNFGVNVVPHQEAWVVERFGKFNRVLEPGLQLLVPIVDKITYVHSLKEEAHSITQQSAITHDNVTIAIDGILYLRVVDPVKASYEVDDPVFAVTQLAQTAMRSELGKMTLDQTFKERQTLNDAILRCIGAPAASWGVQVLRYEIRDIQAPTSVREAMDKQVEANKLARADAHHLLPPPLKDFLFTLSMIL